MITLPNRHRAKIHAVILNIARMDLANFVGTTSHEQLVEFIEEDFALGPTPKLAGIIQVV
jgi:hypothetical protein